MKKTSYSILLYAGLAFTLNSCICMVFPSLCPISSRSDELVRATDDALFGDEDNKGTGLPVVEHPAPPQRNPPDQISGEATSSEPGGGGDQNQSNADQSLNRKRSFKEIITSPSVVLGPSLSWLGTDKKDSEKYPARLGLQLGAVWELPLSPGIQLEPGLLYSNRGMGYENEESSTYEPGEEPGPTYSYKYTQKKRFHYLELPVYASATLFQGLSVYAGPQVAFLLGAKQVNESNGSSSTVKGTKDFKSVDFGLAAGIRYHLPHTFFSIQAGYYHGLTNLSAASDYYGGNYGGPKYHTRSARLGIVYHLPAAKAQASGPMRQVKSDGKKKHSMKAWLMN